MSQLRGVNLGRYWDSSTIANKIIFQRCKREEWKAKGDKLEGNLAIGERWDNEVNQMLTRLKFLDPYRIL